MITSPFGKAGFTIVEVLMAMLIMTVGLLGLLQSVNVAYRHNLGNRFREEAVLVAEEQMNEFRRQPFANLTATNGLCTIKRGVAGGSKEFTVVRQAQKKGGVSSSSKQLNVAVGWTFQRVSTSHAIYSMKSE